MNLPRASGVLLDPTSLPGRFGVGDLGEEARRFVDFLAETGQRYWQVLPLVPPGFSDLPYASDSAFAGCTLLVSLDRLAAEGLLPKEDLKNVPNFPVERVCYEEVAPYKDKLLDRAHQRFQQSATAGCRREYESFCHNAAGWLDDYALFRALKEEYEGSGKWNAWDPGLAHREPAALQKATARLRSRIDDEKFKQFVFFRQWAELKSFCREKGIQIIGDIPIFVAHELADVWANPALFKLNPDGSPRAVAGVPPDYFSATGQRWGNPVYDWDKSAATGYRWWIARMRATLALADFVRLDHFRGFAAYWEIPATEPTAVNGRWVPGPGMQFFAALREALGELPLIAEDLGVIGKDVEILRDQLGLPGMRVIQFGFGSDADNEHLPHNYVHNSVAYTGTHDNDTTVGWFRSRTEKEAKEKEYARQYLHCHDEKEIHWDMIRAVFASVANTAIIPLQDVLGLASEARMNLPGTDTDGWRWRYRPDAISDDVRQRLKTMTENFGRTAMKKAPQSK